MFYYLKKYLLTICLILVSTFLAIGSTLLLIPLSKKLPEIFNSLDNVIFVSFCVTSIYLIKGLFTYFQNVLTGYISIQISSQIRKEVYNSVLHNSLKSFDILNSGQIITTIVDDCNKIRVYLFSLISEFLPSLITIIVTISYIFILNWKLSLFVFLLIPIIAFIISFFNNLITKKSNLIQNRVANSYSLINESLINFLIIKVFGLEDFKQDNFNHIELKNCHENLDQVKLISLQPSVIGVVQVIGICCIACYGGLLIIKGHLSLSDLLAFGTALSITIDPVIHLTKSIGIINSNKVSLDRVFTLKNELNSFNQSKVSINSVNSFSNFDIDFKMVSFSYEEKSIINNLNFNLPKGEILFVKGNNGTGKSTLIKLILGLYNNFSGLITLGKNNLLNYDPSLLRENIKVCFHKPFLFSGSMRDNLILDKNINDSKIIELAKYTGLDSFLDLSRDIGEFGINLSSGQQQKIALTRALLQNPKILLLDEATSAFDQDTESYFYQNIRKILPDSTIIIINHRFKELVFADKVLNLDNYCNKLSNI